MRQRLRIPNFKNFGVIFRALLLANAFLLLLAFTEAQSFADFFALVLQYSSMIQPILFLSILLAYLVMPLLRDFRYLPAALVLYAVSLLNTTAVWLLFDRILILEHLPDFFKTLTLATLLFLAMLYYFFLLDKAYSPAIQEARIQALQARIRPHFLFNSINTALSLIRQQPKQAETALEDMADLFRVFMADNRELVPLFSEIALCKQYLALEKLRLEERLEIVWHVDSACDHDLIPPLILQPLMENAVYHGIEPMVAGGKILIEITKKMPYLHIVVTNPYSQKNRQQQGNNMALGNIKERLLLHFDLEAMLETKQTADRYEVRIKIPLVAHAST
jgi:two-component system sensor histidine kinase AlgZ